MGIVNVSGVSSVCVWEGALHVQLCVYGEF